MLVFLFSVVLTQVQFNTRDSRERAKIVNNSQQADYINALATYNGQVITYQSCLESVQRSDGNRAWKTWLLNKLEETFPDSPQADSIVTEGRQKLDEYLPARKVSDCVAPGSIPTPPQK